MNKNHLRSNGSKPFLCEHKGPVRRPSMQLKLQEKPKFLSNESPNFSSKNSHQYSGFKNTTLGRYASEADLKVPGKINKLYSLQQTEGEDDTQLLDKRFNVQIQQLKQFYQKQALQTGSFRRVQKNESRPTMNKEKQGWLATLETKCKNRQYTIQRGEKPTELKETSSSSTTDLHQKQSKYPSFFKVKSTSKLRTDYGKFSIESFKILKKLGSGKFGTVYLVMQRRTRMVMAMKVFEKKRVIQENYLNQFIRQLKLQTYLEHPSIIKLYGFFHDQKNFYCIMELACHGQLYELIKDNQTLSEQTTSYIIRSLLIAADHMHKMRIFHRDIKPENIVLIHGTVKLCDFGWAVHQKEEELRQTYCGTPLYFSPQLLKGGSYDEKVDIWAIGIMAYELRFGSSPFSIQNQRDLYKIVTEPLKLPLRGVSLAFRQFVSSILQKNPIDRLPCSELLKLRYIKKYQNQICEELCVKSSVFK